MICHKISACQGQAEIVADLTNNYGTRDGPNQWQRYSDKVFIEQCGLTVPHHAPDLLPPKEGLGLLIVAKMTTTSDPAHKGQDGVAMQQADEGAHGQEMWSSPPTRPRGLWLAGARLWKCRRQRSVTLTQPAQIRRQSTTMEDLSLVPRSMCHFTQTGAYRQRSMPTPAQSQISCVAWDCLDGADSHGVTTDPLMARPATISLDRLNNRTTQPSCTRQRGDVTFNQGPLDADIRQPIPFHVAADAGEQPHRRSGAQGIVFKIGSQTTGETFHTISQKGWGHRSELPYQVSDAAPRWQFDTIQAPCRGAGGSHRRGAQRHYRAGAARICSAPMRHDSGRTA
jgi:hypothetical protein